ncbi:hypothetical protein, partial [Escherichia coli]|uniref:glycosyltransferase family 9 protein n=1 Tax=Escherichia coli TaxID=562 RepID=UPI002FC6C87F
MKTVGIGDTVLLSGVIHDIRAQYPNAKIIFFVSRPNAPAARLIEGLDEIVEISVFHLMETITGMRKRKLDVMLDFGAWPRIDAIMSAFCGAPSCGFDSEKQYRHYPYSKTALHRRDCHEIDNYRRLAGLIGVQSTTEPQLRLPGPAK